MKDYQIFDPYFSDNKKEKISLSISELCHLLFFKIQTIIGIENFPKLEKIHDQLTILEEIDQKQFFSKTENSHIQETLNRFIYQAQEISVNNLLKALEELVNSIRSNSRSELIVLLFSKVAPKSFQTKSLTEFKERIKPILKILPTLPELELASLKKRLNQISTVYEQYSPEADKEINNIIQKYHSA